MSPMSFLTPMVEVIHGNIVAIVELPEPSASIFLRFLSGFYSLLYVC